MGSRRTSEASGEMRVSSVQVGSRAADRTSARSDAPPTAEPVRRRQREFYDRQLQPEIPPFDRSDGWADKDAESHQVSRAAKLNPRDHSSTALHPADETRDHRQERRHVWDDVREDTNSMPAPMPWSRARQEASSLTRRAPPAGSPADHALRHQREEVRGNHDAAARSSVDR